MYFSVYLCSFSDNALLHDGVRGQVLWLNNIAFRIDLPVFLVKIELRNQVDQLHVRFPIRAKCSDVLPVTVVLICKKTLASLMAIRDNMLAEIASALILHRVERFL